MFRLEKVLGDSCPDSNHLVEQRARAILQSKKVFKFPSLSEVSSLFSPNYKPEYQQLHEASAITQTQEISSRNHKEHLVSESGVNVKAVAAAKLTTPASSEHMKIQVNNMIQSCSIILQHVQ